MRVLVYGVTCVFPWALRRRLLQICFGYVIDPTARIGLAWVLPDRLVMGPGSRIHSLTVCKGLSLLRLDEEATIGRGNWITAFPQAGKRHFEHQQDRRAHLIVGRHASITNRHIIDCTNAVTVGPFATVAGFRSQILSHSIDLDACRQSSAPITIGEYCFVGTDSVLLGGSELPARSVLAAKSLLNRRYADEGWIYAGVPARPIKALATGMGYFVRTIGFVW